MVGVATRPQAPLGSEELLDSEPSLRRMARMRSGEQPAAVATITAVAYGQRKMDLHNHADADRPYVSLRCCRSVSILRQTLKVSLVQGCHVMALLLLVLWERADCARTERTGYTRCRWPWATRAISPSASALPARTRTNAAASPLRCEWSQAMRCSLTADPCLTPSAHCKHDCLVVSLCRGLAKMGAVRQPCGERTWLLAQIRPERCDAGGVPLSRRLRQEIVSQSKRVTHGQLLATISK